MLGTDLVWFCVYPARTTFNLTQEFYDAPTYLVEAATHTEAVRKAHMIDDRGMTVLNSWATLEEAIAYNTDLGSTDTCPLYVIHNMADGAVVPMCLNNKIS